MWPQAVHTGLLAEDQLQTVERAFTLSSAQLGQSRQDNCQLQVLAPLDSYD